MPLFECLTEKNGIFDTYKYHRLIHNYVSYKNHVLCFIMNIFSTKLSIFEIAGSQIALVRRPRVSQVEQ